MDKSEINSFIPTYFKIISSFQIEHKPNDNFNWRNSK